MCRGISDPKESVRLLPMHEGSWPGHVERVAAVATCYESPGRRLPADTFIRPEDGTWVQLQDLGIQAGGTALSSKRSSHTR